MAMRVIAGTAGGIPLRCPSGGQVRPTMDQVRAAIFSSLAEIVEGAEILDLFAGTGGLGIEALSRGAKTAIFVDKDRRAIDCIKQNLAKARLEVGANVISTDVFIYCSRLIRDPNPRRFNLIFADPPYQTKEHPVDLVSRLLNEAKLECLLAPNGVVVLEKSPKFSLSIQSSGWEIFRQKRYGTAEIVFLRRSTESLPTLADSSPASNQ